MNNGLRGRYLEQLEAWNNARRFAAETVNAFFTSGKSLRDVLSRWGIQYEQIISPQTLKKVINSLVFENSRNTIDGVARRLMRKSEWYNVEPPGGASATPSVAEVPV